MRQRVRLRDPPGRGIGDADVEHFACGNQVIQSAHDLFHRRDLVPDVNPIEIDVVGLQSLRLASTACTILLRWLPAAFGSVPGAALVYFVAITTL